MTALDEFNIQVRVWWSAYDLSDLTREKAIDYVVKSRATRDPLLFKIACNDSQVFARGGMVDPKKLRLPRFIGER